MKKGHFYLFFSVFFLVQIGLLNFCFSQTPISHSTTTQLSGYILSKDSLQAIPNASVLNLRTQQGTTSNDFGFFKLNMALGDTISFTSIGYSKKYFYFKRDLLAQNYNIQVLMSNDTFELKTFVYKEPNYQNKLKKEFEHYFVVDSLAAFHELSKREMRKNRDLIYNASELYHPVTYFYDRYNKQARNWRKIDRYRYIIQKAEAENKLKSKKSTDDYYSK